MKRITWSGIAGGAALILLPLGFILISLWFLNDKPGSNQPVQTIIPDVARDLRDVAKEQEDRKAARAKEAPPDQDTERRLKNLEERVKRLERLPL